MIEIICDGGDDKGENANSVNSTGIRKPKNIKQIGDVSSGKQIYIEDYAFTYINSIAYNSLIVLLNNSIDSLLFSILLPPNCGYTFLFKILI